MRGKVVYGYTDADGEVLTWFGRDPEFEEKRQRWEASGRTEREPEKFHFVRGFHRGQCLFGMDRWLDPERRELLERFGLILVEGPNDAIRLDTLDVPSLALCSNTIAREQATLVAEAAKRFAGGVVTLLLDNDEPGEAGARQCLEATAPLCPVRLAWTRTDARFAGRQPESLTLEEWAALQTRLERPRLSQ